MHLSQKAKKALAAGLALSTMMWSVSLFALPVVSAAPHSEGCLVNSGGTVYLVTGGQRRGFTSAEVFASHGYNFGQVVSATMEDNAMPVGPIMTYADGSIVKGPNDPLVYLVANGQKRGFVSGSVFTGLGYSFANIQWAPVNTFQDLPTGSNVESSTERHPGGTLVQDGSGTVWWMTATGRKGIPSMEVFNSYGKTWNMVVAANAADLAAMNEGVLTMRAMCTGGDMPTPIPSGSISVSLASNTPASGTIVSGQATADLLRFVVTGSGTLGSVMLTRSGISDQNTLTNVYLYDGATRLTDGYSFNSSSTLTMNNLNLPVNGSRTLSVKADVAGSVGQTVAVAVTGVMATGSTMTTASVMGNTMTLASGSTLATASLGANTVTGSPTVNAGTNGYVFFSAPLQVNTRSLMLKAANFRMIGSAPSNALANIRMYVDGVDSGMAGMVSTTNGSNYITFDFMNSPKTLTTGSHVIDVRGDIQNGSNRTLQLSLQNASDLMIMDPQVGVNIAVSGTIPSNAATVTIGTGSITAVLDPSFQAMTNVTGGASNVAVAKFKLRAYGEDVKVQTLTLTPTVTNPATTYVSGTVTVGTGRSVTVASTAGFYVGDVITIAGATQATGTITAITSSTVMVVDFTTGGVTPAGAVTNTTSHNNLDDVTLFFNGSQIGTQQDFTGAALTFQLGSQLIVPAGTDSTLEVRANVRSTTGVNYTGGTIGVALAAGSSNAQGQNSFNTVSTPGVTQPALTVQTGLLAVSANTGYLSQNANPNTAGVKIGSFTLQNQSSSEAVRVTNLNVNVAYGAGTSSTNLSGLRTSETTGSGSAPQQPSTAAASANANNTFSVDFTLAPGATKTIDIFADSSTNTGGTATVQTTLTVTSIGTVSNVSATSSAVAGQTIAFQTGTMATPTLVTASTTPAQYVAAGMGGAVNGSTATYNFVSTNASAVITELKFSVTGANTVTKVKVGSVEAPVVGGIAYLTGLNLAVPNGGSGLTQNVMVDYSTVGTGGVDPATTSVLTLTYVKSTSGGTTSEATVSVAAPSVTLVGSKPTLTVPMTAATGLSISGESKIGEVTVAADAKGNIKVNEIVFTVSSSGFSTAPTAIGSPRIADGTTTVSGSGCTPSSLVVTCEFGTVGDTFNGSESNADFDGITIAAGTSKTFSLFGTLTGAAATGSGTPTVSASISASGFNWDDTSTNGATGKGLTGALIYNFPTNSYTVRQ